jgi:hypothetical protein
VTIHQQIHQEAIGSFVPTIKLPPDTGRWRVARIWSLDEGGYCLQLYWELHRWEWRDGVEHREQVTTFNTEEEAIEEAIRRHRQDVTAERKRTMSATTRRRLGALQALGETFSVRYGKGPRWQRWPTNPHRYAVKEYSERYGESFWETAKRGELEDRIATGDMERIVDLDTGRNVPFSVSVSVGS